jgi:hypothetical protein
MLRDKSKITGLVRATVISVDAEGLRKLDELRSRFAGQGKPVAYCEERDRIMAEHGHKKRRTTWSGKLIVAAWQSLIRRKFREIWNLIRYEVALNHNIVTDEGDALIADQMAETPARTKVDNTNGHITVGTGWTGTTPKANTAVNTPTGSPEVMDATYPVLKGTWGNTDDNVVQYRATFEAGDLNASGIDEAGLGNNAVEASGDNLAYGQITPSVNVGTSDTLQVDWEITFLGA